MKKLFTIVCLLVLSIGAFAQAYNNEWIDYSKTYYKFKVGSTGLYRIPQSVLAGAGMGGVLAQNFQLFRNGKEVPIYVTGNNPGAPLGGSDYIEFWGQRNDGVPDAPLYRSPGYQHTQYYSLETDTAVYFLVENTTGNAFHFRDTVNNVAGSSLAPETSFMYTAGSYFKSGGYPNPGFAQVVGEYIYSSSYDIGEFWSTDAIAPGTPHTDAKGNLFVYSGAGAPDATLRFGMAGAADNVRSVSVSVNGTTVDNEPMNSFSDLLTTKTVPLGVISSGSSATVSFVNGSAVSTDRMVASFYELTYPRQWNFGGQSSFLFQLPAKATGYLLNITNFAVSGSIPPVLYDLTDGSRYTAVVNAGTVSFALPASSATHSYVLVNEDASTIRTVTSLTSKQFVNYSQAANQGNYIIISNPLLYTGSNGNNPVADYKAYRSSVAGGSFAANIYDINELVDQFAFGIQKDPLSIQNFLRYARAKFGAKPQYVLLIGHAMTYNDYYYYHEVAHDPIADRLNLVPTFGSPASDNKLTATNGVDAVQGIPVGRISAVSAAEVEVYFSKLKEYENAQATSPNTIDGRLWMKNVLHLTGVSEPYLGTIICNYMQAYKTIISDTLCGSNVSLLCDGNASSVSQVPSGFVSTLFNNGFSMMDYFGHSSNQVLGYDLDNPEVYNNAGKYPVFYLNGCDAGDFFVYDPLRFTTNKTFSENYVLAREKGAIAAIASTHFGIVNYLNILLNNMYQLMDGPDYGKPIGVLEKDALQALVNIAPNDYFARLHAEQMTMHGDPFLRLNQSALPDYDIEQSQVLISPLFVSVASTSFQVKARFYNLGKAVSDSIRILVKRRYPNGTTDIVLSKKIRGISYADSITLNLPVIATRDKGQNDIIITINSDNTVPEITMGNNSITSSVFVYEEEAQPVYPYNYAIVNNSAQKLYASTANPFSAAGQYVMELDTTSLFNSASKITKTITSVGGLLEFDPLTVFADSTVNYWRVSKVPSGTQPYNWNQFSFVYRNASHSGPGSNQSHFFQHTESTLDGLVLDTAGRNFKFAKLTNVLSAKCGVFPNAANQAQDISVLINGDGNTIQSVCGISELIIDVFDQNTFHPWFNASTGQPGRFGSLSPCGDTREHSFMYDLLDATQRKSAMQLLDSIPDGDYVVVENCSGVDPASNTYAKDWQGDTSFLGSGNSIYARLLGQGWTTIDSFYRPRAFIFMYQKNRAANFAPRSVFSEGVDDKISLVASYLTPDSVGYVTSPSLGPSKKWQELHWGGGSLETPSTDSVQLQVLGVDSTGAVSSPLFTLKPSDVNLDISSISASQYPYLRLRMIVRDTLHGTPYQLKYWRLNYEPAPEGALAPNVFLQSKDTVVRGETINFGIAFKNISPQAFDSMVLKLIITDKSNVPHVIALPKMKPLVNGDTLKIVFPIDTKTYPGLNTIYLDVNPNNSQPEQYHFNNFLYKTIYVRDDSRSPQLDVTFDNAHILNDDIVSARPRIQIKLTSQSQYVLLTDTSLISVKVQYPDGSIHAYSLNTDTMRFVPATSGSNNTATIDFYPAFTKQYNPDGDTYQLIVSGKDPLGNTAGVIAYRVSFKVITKAMISNMLNYPNPFTTSTAFVFTITGSEVPQNIKIQILTITGKIVREITKEELGPLHVGRNITEFKWNGTDMYGQRLANGVYLYHVVTNLNGKSLDKYKPTGDNTDKFFNNGYGKMYLMK
ncbi:MAG: hypothetical protein JST42_23740 [Bacteroidetes bacterium]|nr:hypothetical protein [Bacteroidota bacterium]